MKFVIICKNKSNIKLIKGCDSKDLVIMATSIIEESIRVLTKEMNISRENSISIIKEILEEKTFM